jgi:Sec-independent protein secretion pathway component TatC
MAISLKRRSEARPQPDSMTLVEHLTELRSRVLVCVVAFLITGTVASTSPDRWTGSPCG